MPQAATRPGLAPNYILLPRQGVQPRTQGWDAAALLRRLPRSASTLPPVEESVSRLLAAVNETMILVDAIRETGAKLVHLAPWVAEMIDRESSSVRTRPLVIYALPVRALRSGGPHAPASVRALLPADLEVLCRDAKTQEPLADCEIEAYADFDRGRGYKGKTDAAGRLMMSLTTGWIERLYVKPSGTHWGAYRADFAADAGPLVIDIAPVDPAMPDILRSLYPHTRFNAATGVKVGVIDTGIYGHPQLNIEHNENTVTGEPKFEGDDWLGHGTHVAGIIGARGLAGGLPGMAPGVPLRGYRVFGKGTDGATNYSILKAIINAVDDGCDIINLSLGGDEPDEVVAEGIADARQRGVLVVVAAGNGARGRVDYPAAYTGATAVVAMGVKGTVPVGSYDSCHFKSDPVSQFYPDDYVAAFSDYGPQVSVIAPGVGIVSTMPGGGYAPLSGTSMAAPVVSGAAACLLSNAPAIYALARNAERSRMIEQLLLTACRSRGFPKPFEGAGMPDPSLL